MESIAQPKYWLRHRFSAWLRCLRSGLADSADRYKGVDWQDSEDAFRMMTRPAGHPEWIGLLPFRQHLPKVFLGKAVPPHLVEERTGGEPGGLGGLADVPASLAE
jgi:hypothetical protein